MSSQCTTDSSVLSSDTICDFESYINILFTVTKYTKILILYYNSQAGLTQTHLIMSIQDMKLHKAFYVLYGRNSVEKIVFSFQHT